MVVLFYYHNRVIDLLHVYFVDHILIFLFVFPSFFFSFIFHDPKEFSVGRRGGTGTGGWGFFWRLSIGCPSIGKTLLQTKTRKHRWKKLSHLLLRFSPHPPEGGYGSQMSCRDGPTEDRGIYVPLSEELVLWVNFMLSFEWRIGPHPFDTADRVVDKNFSK